MVDALLAWSPPIWIDSSDGVRLPVCRRSARTRPDDTIDSARPTVLLAHATGFHGRVYDPLVAALTELDVVTADLRGHGDAESPAGLDYRWESFAEDLMAVIRCLRSLDSTPAAPLLGWGHSMGAACLLMVEQAAPGTFDALFCYEPVIHPPPSAVDAVAKSKVAESKGPGRAGWIERTRKRRDRFESRSEARANYASKSPYDVFDDRALDAYIDHGFATDAEGRLHLKCRPEVEARIYEMGPRHQTWNRLSLVRCPVLVARGSIVTPGPSAWADRIASEIPNGELFVFDGLGHLGPLEDPARVGETAAAFFRDRRAGTIPG
jgi:pimeloyl-ACP methyl ester carboxylesterase